LPDGECLSHITYTWTEIISALCVASDCSNLWCKQTSQGGWILGLWYVLGENTIGIVSSKNDCKMLRV